MSWMPSTDSMRCSPPRALGRRESTEECCYGHGPTDRWDTNLTFTREAGLTTSEVLELADPRSMPRGGHIEYPIFHHFHYDHCNMTSHAYERLIT